MYSFSSCPKNEGAQTEFVTANSNFRDAMEMSKVRAGIKDVWNAFMLEGASYTQNDIPICHTSAVAPPEDVITWEEAKSIYKKHLAKKDKFFTHKAFVCFYMDDYKFDGTRGIWHDYNHALNVLRHFGGVITPDFSTYQDFPEPIKIYNTYRMRAFGSLISVFPTVKCRYWSVKSTVYSVIPRT